MACLEPSSELGSVEMDETRDADAAIRRFSTVSSVLIFGAVVTIAYRCDRAYRQWVREISPLASHRARLERMRTAYGEKRANATEVTQFIGGVFDEIDRATRAKSGR